MMTEDEDFAKQQMIVDALVDQFIANEVVAETALYAIGIYIGLVGGKKDLAHWQSVLAELIDIGASDDEADEQPCHH
jgi:hypothetical protein